ncbi:MAG: hypothetical protein LC640_00600 [Frankia sp.]|nr:hypothetical protein [Frankia sp.]
MRIARDCLRRPPTYPAPPIALEVIRGWAADWADELYAMDELAASVLQRRRVLVERLRACHLATHGTGVVGQARVFWPAAFREGGAGHSGDASGAEPGAESGMRLLPGRDLREACIDLLGALGAMTIAELLGALRTAQLEPARSPHKAISDSLRAAMRAGVVARTERGRYAAVTPSP